MARIRTYLAVFVVGIIVGLLQPALSTSVVAQTDSDNTAAKDFFDGLAQGAGQSFVSGIAACRDDVEHAATKVKESLESLGTAFSSKSATSLDDAMKDFSGALTDVQGALDACDITGVAQFLKDVIPAFEHDVQVTERILVAGEDVTDNLSAAVEAAMAKDWNTAGADVTKALITVFGRKAGPLEKFLAEFLVAVEDMHSLDVGTCRGDAVTAYVRLSAAVHDLKDAGSDASVDELVAAVKDMDAALDSLQNGLTACGINGLSQVITDTFKNADSQLVKRIIGANHVYIKGAEIFSRIVAAADALAHGNTVDFGEDMAKLLLVVDRGDKFRAVVQKVVGLLEALKGVKADMKQCKTDFGASAEAFHDAMVAIKTRSGVDDALSRMAEALDDLSSGLNDCGFNAGAQLVDRAFGESSIHVDGHVFTVDDAYRMYLKGVDVTAELEAAAKAWLDDHDLAAVGTHLAKAALDAGLNGMFKKWVSAALRVSSVFNDFDADACKQDIAELTSDIHEDFMVLSAPVGNVSKDDVSQAMTNLVDQFVVVDDALVKCGVTDGLKLLSTWKDGRVSSDAKIALNDIDVTNTVIVAAQEWRDGSYAHSAVTIGKAVFQARPDLVNKALGKFLEGLMQGLENTTFSFDFGQCKNDVARVWASLNDAYGSWKQKDRKDSVIALADAFSTLSDALADCGVRDAARVLSVAATHFGAGVIVDTLRVIVHGIDIARDLGDMWEAYEEKDYVALGTHTADLIRTVLFKRRTLSGIASEYSIEALNTIAAHEYQAMAGEGVRALL